MPKWICRERCFWRDIAWEAGEEVSVGNYQDRKWKLGGGWWAPEGIEVVDLKANLVIPFYFEPSDHSLLVDPKDLYDARNHKKTPRDWLFTFEMDEPQVAVADLPLPEPLTPDTFKQLQEDPEALVTQRPARKKPGPKPKL